MERYRRLRYHTFQVSRYDILAALAVVSVTALVIYPVIAQATLRQSDETACLSHAQQLGAALMQYTSDYDNRFPPSYAGSAHGWAGRLVPYVVDPAIMHCPKDGTRVTTTPDGTGVIAMSYALNGDLARKPAGTFRKAVGGISVDDLTESEKTVALFEIAGDPVDVTSIDEGTGSWKGAPASGYLSAVGIGIPGRLWARWDDSAGAVTYATGNIGGRAGFDPPRHAHGAIYIAADGHAVQLPSSAVSGGRTAKSEDGAQDSPLGTAAGTDTTRFKLTFSPQ